MKRKGLLGIAVVVATLGVGQMPAHASVSCDGSVWNPAFVDHLAYSDPNTTVGTTEVRVHAWMRCTSTTNADMLTNVQGDLQRYFAGHGWSTVDSMAAGCHRGPNVGQLQSPRCFYEDGSGLWRIRNENMDSDEKILCPVEQNGVDVSSELWRVAGFGAVNYPPGLTQTWSDETGSFSHRCLGAHTTVSP